jgi:hypothetical protein
MRLGSQPKSQGGRKHMSNSINVKMTDPEPFLKFLRETTKSYDELLTSGGILAAMQVSFAVDAGAAKDLWKAAGNGGGRYAAQEGHPAKALFDWLVERGQAQCAAREAGAEEAGAGGAGAGGAGAAGARLRQGLGDRVAEHYWPAPTIVCELANGCAIRMSCRPGGE